MSGLVFISRYYIVIMLVIMYMYNILLGNIYYCVYYCCVILLVYTSYVSLYNIGMVLIEVIIDNIIYNTKEIELGIDII